MAAIGGFDDGAGRADRCASWADKRVFRRAWCDCTILRIVPHESISFKGTFPHSADHHGGAPMNYNSELRRLKRLLRADYRAYLDELGRPRSSSMPDQGLSSSSR